MYALESADRRLAPVEERRTPTLADARHVAPAPVGIDERRSAVFAVVDTRRLERECFIRSIELLHPEVLVLGFGSIEDCLAAAGTGPKPLAVILNIGGRLATQTDTAEEIRRLVANPAEIPVVVLAEAEDLSQMIAVIDNGARGYIPAGIGIDAVVEATKLASSGGVFLTTRFLASLRDTIEPAERPAVDPIDGLTSRQAAVAEALRLGKPNKIIAYELNMCESTVKVHIRNILKKLSARNRTEAAYKLSEIHTQRQPAR
jgi:DNA-binding NarL/FixJ family response regulator